MSDVLGFAAYLLLPFIGIVVWRLDAVRELAIDGRIAVAGAAGALFLGMLMSAMSLVHLSWTRTALFLVLAIFIAITLRGVRFSELRVDWSPALLAVLALFAIVVYASLTARATIGDLLFFWGPKGVHFQQAGKIDVDFLRNPDHFLQHRDYPPLLPALFAWSMALSRTFSWWSAILFTALCAAAIVSMIRSFTRDNLSGLLAMSILAWCFVRPWIAGGADPLLLLYETLAVCALVFARDAPSQTILAMIGLGGAIVTKVEGASFVAAVLLALLLQRMRFQQLALIASAPLALLGAWLTFLYRTELFDTYRGPGALSLQFFGSALRAAFAAASYDAYWLPWIATLLVIFMGDVKRARLPLTIAAITCATTIFFYLKSPTDPAVFWIPSSAHRVLLTPLVMLLIAAAAAHAQKLPATRDAQRGAMER
ncbi:MAG TPA: hypothetical protein VHW00_08310 [Thermoanaerobaculia bacterium]|nr:hypothetical protein [Thermoanaerobaculia bacterium]